jgi:hypothetical protein
VGKGGGAGWNQFQMKTKSMVFLINLVTVFFHSPETSDACVGHGTGFARVSCSERKLFLKKPAFAITGSKEKFELEPKTGYQRGKYFFFMGSLPAVLNTIL